MEKRRLGGSGVVVSEICLGTMTFGTQANKEESFRIMDKAVDAGIDFFDTAEIYPVPPTADLAGTTEEIVGTWMKDKPTRELNHRLQSRRSSTRLVQPTHSPRQGRS